MKWNWMAAFFFDRRSVHNDYYWNVCNTYIHVLTCMYVLYMYMTLYIYEYRLVFLLNIRSHNYDHIVYIVCRYYVFTNLISICYLQNPSETKIYKCIIFLARDVKEQNFAVRKNSAHIYHVLIFLFQVYLSMFPWTVTCIFIKQTKK